MTTTRLTWAGFAPTGLLALLCAHHAALAQVPPVDAGQLLEQQRRLEQQQQSSPPPRSSPLREPGGAALPSAAGDATVTVRRFTLNGNTLLGDAALQDLLRPWLMQPATTLASLRQAAAALEQAYRDAGWLARVTLPKQDVTAGEIRLEIAEARVGHVKIAPASAADASSPRHAALSARALALLEADLAPGAPLDLETLQRALLIADELPGIAVAGSLLAGEAAGTTDVLLQLAPSPLTRTDISVDNAANRATGSNRLNASLVLESPWGLGEQIGLSASATSGTDYLRGVASLPAGTSGWRIGVNGSALRYHVLDEFNTTTGMAPRGNGQTLGLDALYPLVRTTQAHWNAVLGAEQKRQTNRDDNVTVGVMDTVRIARTRSLNAGINGYAFDALGGGGQTQASAQVVAGRLSLAGSPDATVLGDAQTEHTRGDYALLRWSASRVQTLNPTLSLAAGASGQFANRNLDSSEKLYLGGLGAVNAYPSGEAGGSSGALFNVELRQQFGTAWQLGLFYDWGQVRQFVDNQRGDGTGALTTVNTVTLKGPGASIGWHIDGARVKAVWARRAGGNPLATPAGTDSDGSAHLNRFWLTAGINF